MSEMNHIHTDDIIVDSDVHFKIDTVTRAISSDSNKKIAIMQYDNKSERYSFDIDRVIDGHDLMNCNRVQIHFINIGSSKQKHPGLYLVDDVQIMPSDNNKITFTWLVSQDATMFSGVLSFLISFECVDGDKILYRWSSSIFDSIKITTGMDNDNTIVEMYADELLAWQNKMETEFIPQLIDECYVDRNFATSEEVAWVFDITNPDGEPAGALVSFEEIKSYIDEAVVNSQKPIDSTPTDDSENLVSSGGVKTYVDDTNADTKIYVDESIADIKTYVDDTVANSQKPIDSTPTDDSENLVSSGGVKTYVDELIATTIANAVTTTLNTEV